jgi:hypothetical protein
MDFKRAGNRLFELVFPTEKRVESQTTKNLVGKQAEQQRTGGFLTLPRNNNLSTNNLLTIYHSAIASSPDPVTASTSIAEAAAAPASTAAAASTAATAAAVATAAAAVAAADAAAVKPVVPTYVPYSR